MIDLMKKSCALFIWRNLLIKCFQEEKEGCQITITDLSENKYENE